MAFEHQAWIDEMTEGLPKDKQAQVKSELSKLLAEEALAKKIGESHSRQSDYSRNMDEMKKAQAKRETELQAVAQEYADKQRRLTEWHASAEKIVAEKDKLAKAAVDARARIEAAFKKVADEAGVDPGEYLEGSTGPALSARNPAPEVDMSKYVGREEYDKRIAQIAQSATRWPIMLQGMATRHRQVFGTDLSYDETQELLDQHLKTKTPIDELWADKYKVSAELDKQQEAKIQARIDEAKKQAYEEALAKVVHVPGSLDAPEPVSPVLRHSRELQIKNAGESRDKSSMRPAEKAALRYMRGDFAQPGSPRYRNPGTAA